MNRQTPPMHIAVLIMVMVLAVVSASAQTPAPQAAITPIPAKVIEDPKAPVGWRRYQIGEAPVFSVILPSPPEVSAQRAPGAATAVVNLYITSNDNAVYAASRLQGLGVNMETVTEAARAVFFKNYVEGFTKGFHSSLAQNNITHELKMLPPIKVRAANREAFQQDFTVGPLTGRAQLTFAGSAAFCIITIWNPQTPAIDRESFLNSFQLIGPPK